MRKYTTHQPTDLASFIALHLPNLPSGKLRAAFKRRDVRVNGKRVGEGASLASGDEVALYIAEEELQGAALNVLYQSENLLIAEKPAGVPTIEPGSIDMLAIVCDHLATQGNEPFALACHRLDVQTGGLLLFALNEPTEAAVRALLEAGKVEKTYRCIVRGTPEPSHAVRTAYLKKDAGRALVSVSDRPIPGARTAVTEYTVLKSDGERALLEVKLHTGRTHQIRAHLAHIGYPLLGDDKYGDRAFNRLHKARRQKLWACVLGFSFDPAQFPALKELAGRRFETASPFDDQL